ncbi:hypothetical protein [Brevibacillus borstelensis]|uniref:hypothetical protein n=1 Tax=Brevibacillus borstelensis TaxID=45462 RepID=UPI001D0B24FE|nr:hypothetical protein [Brevibacillus borstelensis]HDI6353919.1 hypothetical protein [Escherichia coli]MCC0567520.1 hypothetical protein [Brevibacillus borstelensis]MCM3473501.1 hypothetical protein [Brevibacillus borstelensis]MCM3561449.1 hypothetical protein [Brevibacillus borstelensis]MCM3594007.1 hypothetical protein [Brevibacillus borstelensis]
MDMDKSKRLNIAVYVDYENILKVLKDYGVTQCVFGKIKVHTLATEKCRPFPKMKKALPAN